MIYVSALYVLRYGLVCSVAPNKIFGALTTAPKFQRNASAETSSTTDGFFPVWTPHSDSKVILEHQLLKD